VRALESPQEEKEKFKRILLLEAEKTAAEESQGRNQPQQLSGILIGRWPQTRQEGEDEGEI